MDLLGCITHPSDFVCAGVEADTMMGMAESVWEPNMVPNPTLIEREWSAKPLSHLGRPGRMGNDDQVPSRSEAEASMPSWLGQEHRSGPGRESIGAFAEGRRRDRVELSLG